MAWHKRETLQHENRLYSVKGNLIVNDEPIKVIHLETRKVEYLYLECILNKTPLFLEQRISYNKSGDQIIRESLVFNIPFK